MAAAPAFAAPQDEMIAYTSRAPQPLVTGSSFRNIVLTGAALGFVIDRIEGSHIAKDDNVIDPQDEIAWAVASEIAARRGVDVADGPIDVRGISRRALARSGPPGRYLVDVESTKREFMWSLIRGQWTKYTVGYRANLAVLDIPNQEFVIKDRCVWSTPKADRLTRARLLDDDSEQLKVQFGIAANACAAQFKAATQGLWRMDDRQVSYEREAPRPQPRAPVAVAPLPDDTRARYVYDAPRPPPPPRPAPVQGGYRYARPAIVEYGYARAYEAPPARAPAPDDRYSGRDANGYLAWPSK
jgi:hypothetical protein